MAKKNFPKLLYVKREKDDNGPDYFVPFTKPEDAAEIGVKINLGLYVLREERTVEGVINEHKAR